MKDEKKVIHGVCITSPNLELDAGKVARAPYTYAHNNEGK